MSIAPVVVVARSMMVLLLCASLMLLMLPTAADRIIAIGDLDGDLVNARRAFQFAEVTDCDGNWIAGTDTVIQLGCIVSHSSTWYQLVEYLLDLRDDARRHGGELILLNGFQEIKAMLSDSSGLLGEEAFGGPEQLKAAINPQRGAYGMMLAKHDVYYVRNQTLFSSRGLPPAFAGIGIAEANAMIHEHVLRKNNTILNTIFSNANRNLLNRNQQSSNSVCLYVEETLARLSIHEECHNRPPITRMVVGTFLSPNKTVYCNGLLYFADTGISAYNNGMIAAFQMLPEADEDYPAVDLVFSGMVPLNGRLPMQPPRLLARARALEPRAVKGSDKIDSKPVDLGGHHETGSTTTTSSLSFLHISVGFMLFAAGYFLRVLRNYWRGHRNKNKNVHAQSTRPHIV